MTLLNINYIIYLFISRSFIFQFLPVIMELHIPEIEVLCIWSIIFNKLFPRQVNSLFFPEISRHETQVVWDVSTYRRIDSH